jgi:hypothetical protein
MLLVLTSTFLNIKVHRAAAPCAPNTWTPCKLTANYIRPDLIKRHGPSMQQLNMTWIITLIALIILIIFLLISADASAILMRQMAGQKTC